MQFIEFDVDSTFYEMACLLRNRILREPLGLDLFSEDLSKERNCRHFGLVAADNLIGYLLIVPNTSHSVVLRQMCIVDDLRRQGAGSRLVNWVEKQLDKSGVETIELAARVPAISFYQKLGYQTKGAEFLSVGIPHVRMIKHLPSE